MIQWDHPHLGKFGVLVVYALNKPHNRKHLWRELGNTIDKKQKWVVAGDFHMVEDVLDRKGG